MKILQLTTVLSLAGAEQIILDLCSMPEHEFVIAGLQARGGTLQKAADTRGVKALSLDMQGKGDIRVFTRLRRLLRDERFDLIHTHLTHANFVGRIVGGWERIPVISTVHGVDRRFRPEHPWMERLTVKRAHRTTVVSEAVRQHMVNGWGLPEDRVVVVPNGIDTERFTFADEDRDIDFLFLGRLVPEKGLDRIIPALKAVSADTGARIVIVGSGQEEARLRALAREHDVSVEWEPFTTEPERWFRRSKICLMPSRSEGFGLVAAEAMASGCVVVHSGVDGLPAVVGPHGRTLSDDPGDWPLQLIATWRSFTENRPGREWVREHFSKAHMNAAFARLYGEAVSGHR